MASTTLWQRVKTGGKTGFDKAWDAVDKLGSPVNKLTNKLGSEAFWPTTIDKESDKAARILKSFCKDGFYAEEERQPADGPKQKQRVVKKIPKEVIQNAKGLAIFTTMRTGLWVSGAGGSGILIGRKKDGTWSPPSGIMLHTAGLGFLVGVDIYDCVVVINTYEALDAFTHIRCTLGSEISVAAGPVGAGGILESELHKRRAPIFTYLKSRGFYAGVQIDGTVIIERTDENERFYGERIIVGDILAGKVTHPPFEIKRLIETIRAAQGDSDVDQAILPEGPPPGDFEVDDGHLFGVPDQEDPDPYGVLALEKEGMGVINANTKKRASWEEFSFNPAPGSPIHTLRSSQDMSRTVSRRSSWRTSAHSTTAVNSPPPPKTPTSGQISILRNSAQKPPNLMTDTATQTDFPDENPPSPSRASVRSGISRHSSRASQARQSAHLQKLPEHNVLDTSPTRDHSAQSTRRTSSPLANGLSTPPHTPPPQADESTESHEMERSADHTPDQVDDDDDFHDDDDAVIEEPTVHSVQFAQPAIPQINTSVSPLKARVVSVPKRGPPPQLPPRNPHRAGKGPMVIDASPVTTTAQGVGAEEKANILLSPEEEKRMDPVAHHGEIDSVGEEMENVKLEDETLDEHPDPWAKVEEKRREEAARHERVSLEAERDRMPGGFD